MIYKANGIDIRFSFGFLKPDCIQSNLVEVVYNIIKDAGLEVLLKKRMQFDQVKAEAMYDEWRSKYFFEKAVSYIRSGSIETFIVKGGNAIQQLNNVVGMYTRNINEPKTIRGKYAHSRTYNIIHSTSNLVTLKREVLLIYSLEELKSYDTIYEVIINL